MVGIATSAETTGCCSLYLPQCCTCIEREREREGERERGIVFSKCLTFFPLLYHAHIFISLQCTEDARNSHTITQTRAKERRKTVMETMTQIWFYKVAI